MASKNKPAIRMVFTATQGSSDAFVQVEVNTGLSTLDRNGYRIIEVGAEVTAVPAVNGASIYWSVSRQSESAVVGLSGRTLLYRDTRVCRLATSGAIYENPVIRWQPTPEANVIIVEETIYVQLDSDSTSQANAINGYILVEPITLTEADKVALIAQSLGNF